MGDTRPAPMAVQFPPPASSFDRICSGPNDFEGLRVLQDSNFLQLYDSLTHHELHRLRHGRGYAWNDLESEMETRWLTMDKMDRIVSGGPNVAGKLSRLEQLLLACVTDKEVAKGRAQS